MSKRFAHWNTVGLVLGGLLLVSCGISGRVVRALAGRRAECFQDERQLEYH